MSNGKGTAVLALIFGLISLGLSGYILYDEFFVENYPEIRTYYVKEDGHVFSSTDTEHLDQMTLDVLVQENQEVYILFNGWIFFNDPGYVLLTIRIDDYIMSRGPNPIYGSTGSNDPAFGRRSVSFHYVNDTLSPGVHTIEIYGRASTMNIQFFELSLFVQVN